MTGGKSFFQAFPSASRLATGGGQQTLFLLEAIVVSASRKKTVVALESGDGSM